MRNKYLLKAFLFFSLGIFLCTFATTKAYAACILLPNSGLGDGFKGLCEQDRTICSTPDNSTYCCSDQAACSDITTQIQTNQAQQNAAASKQGVNTPRVKMDSVDPLQLGGSEDAIANPSSSNVDLSDPGKVLSRAISFAIPLAGLILFVMIVIGGFEMVMGAAESKSKEAGRQRITAAVIGFVVLFSAYWIAQLIQVIFGVKFL